MTKIEEISYGGWQRAMRMANEHVEMVFTLEVGPRVIRFAPVGGVNMFKEFTGQMGKSGEPEWCCRGGHRFWTAPEDAHSYAPDNDPVKFRKTDDRTVELEQLPCKQYGWQKCMTVSLGDSGAVTVTHRLRNLGKQPLAVYPWALSVMAGGGTAIVPHAQFAWHPNDATGKPGFQNQLATNYLPNRRLTLWPYTDFTDPRFKFERDFLILSQKPNTKGTKIGMAFDQGWVAYQIGKQVFCKHIPWKNGVSYPDQGSSLELYTNGEILEVESLAPEVPVPVGGDVCHVEHWRMEACDGDLKKPEVAASFFAKLPAVD